MILGGRFDGIRIRNEQGVDVNYITINGERNDNPRHSGLLLKPVRNTACRGVPTLDFYTKYSKTLIFP